MMLKDTNQISDHYFGDTFWMSCVGWYGGGMVIVSAILELISIATPLQYMAMQKHESSQEEKIKIFHT